MATVNNIEALREARGWKRPELARRMGTSPQQIERLEKGLRRLTREWIDRAADALSVEAAAIITDGALPDVPAAVEPATEGSVALRVVDLGYSMGDGANIDDYVEEGAMEFDAALLRSITSSPAVKLYVARGDGDSMFPTIINGDMVLIDTRQRELNLQDRIWACSILGAGAIKRLRRVGKETIEVRSDNALTGNRDVDAADVHILGRVIWIGRKV